MNNRQIGARLAQPASNKVMMEPGGIRAKRPSGMVQAPINMRNQPFQQNMPSNVSNDGLLNDDPYSNLPNHPPKAVIM